MRVRGPWAGALVAIIVIGLVWRKADLGLPFFLWKYGGSSLWGAMVYVIAGLIAPRSPVLPRVMAALVFAIGAEFSRLYHTPALDAFRLTLAGQLLLGRLFSPRNILAYAVGIAVAAWAEAGLTSARAIASPRSPPPAA